MIFMNIFSLFALPVMKYIPEGKYKIDDVLIEQESFYVSETKITIGEFKKYLEETNVIDVDYFYHNQKRIVDNHSIELKDSYPAWGVTYEEIADYCNWLSEKENLQKCYTKGRVNGAIVITTNYEANGYRLPTLREWYYISELWMNKDASYYESVNILKGKKFRDINHIVPYSVDDEVYNSFGIKDPLGNIQEICNDYFLEGENIKLLKTNKYGPVEFTPDLDQLYFHFPLTANYVRAGGNYYSNLESIRQNFVWEINLHESSFVGFRVVRNR